MDGTLGAYENSSLKFQTGYNTKMVIDGYTGNVGINTLSPTEKLTVNGDVGIKSGSISVFDDNSSKILQFGYQTRLVNNVINVPTIFSSNSVEFKYIDSPNDYTEINARGINLSSNHDFNSECFRLTTSYLFFRKVCNTGNPTVYITNDGNATFNGKVTAIEIETKPNVWPDDVFNTDYKQMSLADLEKYIRINKHLPGVPIEDEVKTKGINMAETDAMLLRKIEELTKYIIEQQKTIVELKEDIKLLKAQ